MSINDINTIPIQHFINAVKGANAKRAREIKLDIDTATKLALTLGEVMTRMNGDLEQIILRQKEQSETINIVMDGGGEWK